MLAISRMVLVAIGCAILTLGLASGANPVTPDSVELFRAVRTNDLTKVKSLIAAGVDVNARGSSYIGDTALMVASQRGNLEIVQALLDAKADVNAKSVVGADKTTIRAEGFDEVWFNGGTALMYASFNNNLPVVKALLAAKADVNASKDNRMTALMIACVSGNLDVARALLAAKANINAKADHGITALMLAAYQGHLEIVQALVAAKADRSAKQDDGTTALMLATQNNHPDVVQFFAKANGTAAKPFKTRGGKHNR